MKQHWKSQLCSMTAIAILLLLGGCRSEVNGTPELETSQPQPTNTNSSRPESTPPFQLDLFTVDELFAVGGGGCGMTLLPVTKSPEEYGESEGDILLFHGIDHPMLMKINGAMMEFELEDSSGEAFYGQKTRQTFSNAELGLTVETEVSLGAPGEIESVEISEGTVFIKAEPFTAEPDRFTQKPVSSASISAIAVQGDAGC